MTVFHDAFVLSVPGSAQAGERLPDEAPVTLDGKVVGTVRNLRFVGGDAVGDVHIDDDVAIDRGAQFAAHVQLIPAEININVTLSPSAGHTYPAPVTDPVDPPTVSGTEVTRNV